MVEEASLKPHNRLDLVVAAQSGDREAMGLLVEQELPWIRAIISGYIGSRDTVVDDICQETFFSAWRKIGKLRKINRFKPWLYTIAVNNVRTFFRKKERNRTVSLPPQVPDPGFQDFEDVLDRHAKVHAALHKLDPKYRDPLIVHYFHGKSCDETAQTLGLKAATTRIRLLRGREKLRKILSKELESR